MLNPRMTTIGRSLTATSLMACRTCARLPLSSIRVNASRSEIGSQQRTISSSTSRWAEVRPGPALSQTNRAEATLRRFWKTVNIKPDEETGGHIVTLDHRNLRTPGGKKLVIPKERRLLAALIANEWDNQDEILKQHALPLTSLASRALDGMTDPKIRAGVTDHLLRYLATDTIFFPDDSPDALVRMQKEHWDPLLSWIQQEYGVKLYTAEGFSPARQTQEAIDKLRALVEGMDHWELAFYATKSFTIGLALVKGRLSANGAAEAAHVEVRSQIERWGEVEDTHDVDYQDIRRALGSVACLLVKA